MTHPSVAAFEIDEKRTAPPEMILNAIRTKAAYWDAAYGPGLRKGRYAWIAAALVALLA